MNVHVLQNRIWLVIHPIFKVFEVYQHDMINLLKPDSKACLLVAKFSWSKILEAARPFSTKQILAIQIQDYSTMDYYWTSCLANSYYTYWTIVSPALSSIFIHYYFFHFSYLHSSSDMVPSPMFSFSLNFLSLYPSLHLLILSSRSSSTTSYLLAVILISYSV